jgi:hypothetical protein
MGRRASLDVQFKGVQSGVDFKEVNNEPEHLYRPWESGVNKQQVELQGCRSWDELLMEQW